MKIEPHFYILGLAFVFVWLGGYLYHIDNCGMGFSAIVSAVGCVIIGAILWGSKFKS